MAHNVRDQIEELQEMERARQDRERARQRKEDFDSGYKAATKKNRRTLCAVSASAALTGFGILKLAAGWAYDNFYPLQVAFDAYMRARGLGK